MITDSQKPLIIDSYEQRGLLKKEIRSYEVSLWSLQDEFMTVLKWSDVEQRGRIEHPKMTLNIDGTLKFSFSIPMYYRDKGKLVENPNWYNTLNGNLMTSLRKIKVIFNKGTDNEGVFEFVITSVTETHDKDILTCEIESEGLAFLELGKIGYKISLSLANFELVYKDWYENHHSALEPIQSVDYWCGEAGLLPWPDSISEVNPRAWYYDVRMNWNSFLNGSLRSSKKVYEEPYTSSWEKVNDVLVPKTEEAYREKARPVEIDKSNLYNITQTIAEAFEIFCRYEFVYDENYHIIGRIVVFYNNFMNEDNMFTILYPYSASKISRKMDSTDTTTKLFILDPDNMTVESGLSSVMNAPPNASKEDYILNFDYMYQTEAITKELYDAIKPFEATVSEKNEELIKYLLELASYLMKKPEVEGKIAVAEKSIKVALELVDLNKKKREALGAKYGDNTDLIVLTYKNPDYCVVRTDDTENKYITTAKTNTGINDNTIKIYVSKNTLEADKLGINLVTAFKLEHDEYNNLTRIVLLDESQLMKLTNINWNSVFTSLYNGTLKGAVDLKNRPIVDILKLASLGYATENLYGYYSLCVQVMQPDTGAYANYDIVYTPITVDGEVRTPTEMRSYIDSVSVAANGNTNWKSYDTLKMIVDVVARGLGSNYYTIEHEAIRNWEKIRYHMGLIEVPDGVFDALSALDKTLIMNNATEVNLTKMITSVYVTYSYNPKLYYDNIIKTWSVKLLMEREKLIKLLIELGPEASVRSEDSDYDLELVYETFTTRSYDDDKNDAETLKDVFEQLYIDGLNGRIKNAEDTVKDKLEEKAELIKEFEHMMGPAIREGYWLPEHYDDYGDRKENEIDLLLTDDVFTRRAVLPEGVEAVAGWDDLLFDEEDTLYYKIGVLETKEYYPCIDLAAVFNNNIPINLDRYSLVWWSNTAINTVDWTSIKDLGVMAVGSDALIKFIRTSNGVIKPVLMLVGAKTFTGPMLERLIVSGGARLEIYNPEGSTIHSNYSGHVINNNNAWICYREDDMSKPEDWSSTLYSKYTSVNATVSKLVYPRIKFKSLAVKTDSSNLRVLFNDVQFKMANDFTVLTRNTEYSANDIVPEYYVTIKPQKLLLATIINSGKVASTNKFKINYIISNANTSIYLDAIKVSKENAYPKASYEVSSNILNVDFVRTLYLKLAQIVMINDTDLKFENTFGYISGLELDLDNCQNDTMEVKNYKTKFEDLFSTIVALTEAMKLSGAGLTTALSGGIPLSEEGLSETLDTLYDILDAYLDSYFDSSLVVKDRLADIFAEAAEILASSLKSLNSMAALTDRNAGELSKFVENIAAELTSEVFRQADRPASFKAGDIWIKMDGNTEVGRYLAIMSSDDLEDLSSETAGFVRTHDGSLANITGAAIDIDAEAGTIDIKAAALINLKSGLDIYIAANRNVDILGNKQVNIGGSLINLCTLNERTLNSNGTFTTTKFKQETLGINIIAGAYRADGEYGEISHILISPKKIKMGSSNIIMRGTSKILMVTSLGTLSSTNVISLDPSNGVWIGSGNGVRLYAGNIAVTQNSDGSFSMGEGVGANVELLPSHLLMGVSNTNSSTTAIEMTDSYVIIGKGNAVNGSGAATKKTTGITGTSSGLVGAKFTRDSIGFATQSGSGTLNDPYIYNTVIMNDNGVTIGATDGTKDLATTASSDLKTYFSTSNSSHGSYVRVAANGIELGSMADIYINANNFKLLTNSRDSNGNPNYTAGNTIFAFGNNLLKIDSLSGKTAALIRAAENNDNTIDVRLVLNLKGLYLKGTVYADAGSFTGSVTATSFILNDNGTFKLSTNNINTSEFNTFINNNTNVSTALATALLITSDASPIVAYGMIGRNTNNAGNTVNNITYDSNGYPKYNNQSYGLILGNSLTLPMLIGSNGGLHIINSQKTASAVVINNSGIGIASGGTLSIDTTNLKISPSASGTDTMFYVGNPTANKYIQLLGDGTLEIRGKIVATGFELTTSAQSDFNGYVPTIDTGMTIADWGRNWDTTQKYLMIKAGNSVPGGIVCGGTDNQSRNFVIPWIAEHALSLDAQGNPVYFETPAFLINKDGLEYRYMTDNGSGLPVVQNYMHINSQGVEVVGSNINITGGNIMINGKAGWSREDIIYAVADSANDFLHPTDRPWIWIKPAATSVAGFSKTFNNGDLTFYTSGTNTGALNNNATIQLNYNAGSSLGTNINVDVTYTISFHSNQSFQSGAYFLLSGALANNSSALNALAWSTTTYATKITPPGYAQDLTITWTQTYNNTSAFDFSGNSPFYIWISDSTRYLCNMNTLYITNITVTASARATEGAHVPCSVYYYSS